MMEESQRNDVVRLHCQVKYFLLTPVSKKEIRCMLFRNFHLSLVQYEPKAREERRHRRCFWCICDAIRKPKDGKQPSGVNTPCRQSILSYEQPILHYQKLHQWKHISLQIKDLRGLQYLKRKEHRYYVLRDFIESGAENEVCFNRSTRQLFLFSKCSFPQPAANTKSRSNTKLEMWEMKSKWTKCFAKNILGLNTQQGNGRSFPGAKLKVSN